MADKATIDEVTSAAADIPRPQSGEPKVWSLPGSFVFGTRRISIEKVFINGKAFTPTHDIRLKKGDLLEFDGSGLSLFDSASFLSESFSSLKLVLKNSSSGDAVISFVVPDLGSTVKDGGYLWLRLGNRQRREVNRIIAPYLVYSVETEKERKQKSLDQEEEKLKRQKSGSAANLPGLAFEPVGGPLGGITSALAGSGAGTPNQGAMVQKSGVGSIGSGPTSGSDVDDGSGLDVEHSAEKTISSQVTPETIQQSTALVGEYIDKNPEVIADAVVRREVLSALSTGSVVNLSQKGRAALQISVTNAISSQGDASGGQLQAAMRMVNQQVLEGRVTIQGSSTVSSSGTIFQTAHGEVHSELKQQSIATGISSLSQPVRVQATLRQNLNTIAEHIDKNPDTIINSNIRKEVQLALATRDVAGLSAEAKATLQRTLGVLGRGEGEAIGPVASAAQAAQAQLAELELQPAASLQRPPGHVQSQASQSQNKTAESDTNVSAASSFQEKRNTEAGESLTSVSDKKLAAILPPSAEGGPSLDDRATKLPSGVNLSKLFKKNDQADEKKLSLGDARNSAKEKVGLTLGSAGPKPLPPSGRFVGEDENLSGGSKDGIDINGTEPGIPAKGSLLSPLNLDNLSSNTDQEEQGQDSANDSNGSRSSDKNSPKKSEEKQQEQQKQQPAIPQAGQAALAAAGPEGALAGKAINAVAGSKLGQEVIGQATSKLWWWGFGFSSATFFLGLDFFVGAAIMDVYWWRHHSQPKLFPMKGWQKAVTVFANVFPIFALLLFLELVMVVGCNWPVPKSALVPTYRGSILGSIIGDDCKYFDASNIISKPTTTPTGAAAPQVLNPSSSTPTPPK